MISRPLPLALVLVLTGALAASAQAGDFMDTTITFIGGDDNVFAGAGETIPSSPRADFRPRTGNNLFYENYNTRNTGEETRTHLVLYKEFEGYFDRVTPEAAMVLQWDLNRMVRDQEQAIVTDNRRTFGGLRDDGSYLGVHWETGASAEDAPADRVSLILFPFDSDRFRLGYSYELTWGGRQSFVFASAVPGLRLSYRTPRFYAFVGGKSARTQTFTEGEDDPKRDENEAIYGVLAGAGFNIGEHLLLEANGGFFEKGTIPLERAGLTGTALNQFGASAQLTYFDGIVPQTSVDTRLLRNLGDKPLTRKWTPRSFGYLVSAELTLTSQNLADGDALTESKRELGYAGDINTVVQSGRWTFSLDVVARSLEFLVQDTPGLFPYSTVPEELETSPELFAALGADYTVEGWYVVPGITLGVQQPAQARVESADSTLIVRKVKNVLGETTVEPTPLPPGEDATPIFSSKLSFKSYLSDLIMVVAQAQLTVNNNLVTSDPDEGGRKFENPYVLGLSVIAQARF